MSNRLKFVYYSTGSSKERKINKTTCKTNKQKKKKLIQQQEWAEEFYVYRISSCDSYLIVFAYEIALTCTDHSNLIFVFAKYFVLHSILFIFIHKNDEFYGIYCMPYTTRQIRYIWLIQYIYSYISIILLYL